MTEASIAERLRARQRPTVPVALPLDRAAAETAKQKLEEAARVLRRAVLADDPDATTAAEKALADAEAAFRAAHIEIVLQALPPAEYEALFAAHPPTPQQREADPEAVVDDDTFAPALLAACATEACMSEDEWAEVLACNVSKGERQSLYLSALMVNEQARAAEPSLPKGFGSMPSWPLS